MAGLTVINDASGFGWRHFRCLGLDQIRAIIAFLNGGFPIWIRRIHVVNQPRLFGVLFNMVKPFLDERVKDMIVFHGYESIEVYKRKSKSVLKGATMTPYTRRSARRCFQRNLGEIYICQ